MNRKKPIRYLSSVLCGCTLNGEEFITPICDHPKKELNKTMNSYDQDKCLSLYLD